MIYKRGQRLPLSSQQWGKFDIPWSSQRCRAEAVLCLNSNKQSTRIELGNSRHLRAIHVGPVYVYLALGELKTLSYKERNSHTTLVIIKETCCHFYTTPTHTHMHVFLHITYWLLGAPDNVGDHASTSCSAFSVSDQSKFVFFFTPGG